MGRTVVGLLLAAALAAGCSRSNPTPTAAAPGPESAVGPGYSYEVRGEGAVSHGTASEPLSVSAGKNALTIKDGRLTVNKQAVAMPELQGALADVFRDRHDKTLFISADGSLPYGRVVSVIDAAKGAGVARVGVITESMRGR